MRCLERNKRSFYYVNPTGDQIDVLDRNGNKTGERIQLYDSSPNMASANVSQQTGVYRTEEFGNLENYDRVIVTDDLNCPIREDTVLFVDKEPSRTAASTYRLLHSGARPIFVEDTYYVPVPDYVVWRVAKSLNHVAIAIKKVTTGPYGTEEPYPGR